MSTALSPGDSGGSVVRVDDADPRVLYGSQPLNAWTAGGSGFEYNDTTHGSTTNGATLTFNFTGTSISLYGTLGAETGSIFPCSIFQVDNNSFVSPAQLPPPQTLYKQLLYNSTSLPAGTHTFTFTVDAGTPECGKGNATWPLWVDYLQYTPADLAAEEPSILSSSSFSTSITTSSSTIPTSGTTAIPTPIKAPSSTPQSASSVPAGPIIGVAAGSLVVLATLIILAVVWRRRQRMNARKMKQDEVDFLPSPYLVSAGTSTRGAVRLPITTSGYLSTPPESLLSETYRQHASPTILPNGPRYDCVVFANAPNGGNAQLMFDRVAPQKASLGHHPPLEGGHQNERRGRLASDIPPAYEP